MNNEITTNSKSLLAYEALCDIAQEEDDAGNPANADRVMECADELSVERLARLYDILVDGAKNGKASVHEIPKRTR